MYKKDLALNNLQWLICHKTQPNQIIYIVYIYIYIYCLEDSVFANGQGDWGSIQVESYQRLRKWYLMLPCLTLSIVRYGSRVKWSSPGKGVVPSTTLRCCSSWKGAFELLLATVANFTFILCMYKEDLALNDLQ